MITPLILILVVTVLAVGIGLRFTAWGQRTSTWLQSLATSGVEAPPTKFSEWVSFAGFGLTIVGVGISWYTVTLQNQKASLEAIVKDLTDQAGTVQQQIQSAARKREDFAKDVDIHLTAPIRDVGIIANRVNFEWSYAKHNDHLSYIIELLLKDRPELPPNQAVLESDTCDFSRYRSCRFYATAPTSQHSQLSLANISGGDGEYLWRVVPVKAKSSPSTWPADEGNLVSEWSEYGSFSFYPSLMRRMTRTRRVILGTTYSDNVHFSSIDPSGNHRGHDVDLLRILVEGCLAIVNSEQITFDDSRCTNTTAAYLDSADPPAFVLALQQRAPSLTVEIKAFPSVSEGLEAVSRKEIDAFVGSLTKAQERENDAVIFTDGYYDFETDLYAHSVQPGETLTEWVRVSRRIGVIDNSTNHWLATLLTAEEPFQNKLSVVAFASFPALQSAFERRQVDGILIDDVLCQDVINPDACAYHRFESQDIWPVRELNRTAAWAAYYQRLGNEYDKEQFAIAVATDKAQAPPPRLRILGTLFNTTLVRFGSETPQTGLYEPLQLALHSPQLVSIRSLLRTSNRLPPEAVEGVSFPTKP
jgi:ABC-type amino acid transport substrate-binding protein